jgi:hypothetical protein
MIIIPDDVSAFSEDSLGTINLLARFVDRLPPPPCGINCRFTAVGQPYLFDAENNNVWLADDEHITQFFTVWFLPWIHV